VCAETRPPAEILIWVRPHAIPMIRANVSMNVLWPAAARAAVKPARQGGVARRLLCTENTCRRPARPKHPKHDSRRGHVGRPYQTDPGRAAALGEPR
jgi:hypothetical protein